MKNFILVLFVLALCAGAAAAAETVPGDVLVIFRNPFPDVPVTAESLARGGTEAQEAGVHAAYLESVAGSLDATVAYIYEALSVSGGELTALFHTDAKSETTLWMELRLRPDVKGASLNYVRRLNMGRAR